MKNILLLDGYNLIYRARYSGMNKGEYSTIFNFFRSIRPLVEKFDPDICYFVLEGMPKKRLAVDPEYKGQRVYHNKDNFSEQRKEIIRIIKEIFPFITTRHNDYECDDILNYLANVKHSNDKTTIISSDTDFIQSINENNQVYNPVKKCFIEQVEYDYVKWKALVGDKSDNIIGFNGIGNKRAQKMLSDNSLLEDFLLKENNRNKFKENIFMVAFHELGDDSKGINYSVSNTFNWQNLKNDFINMSFSSIISKEKTWEKYINTFQKLERNLLDVN